MVHSIYILALPALYDKLQHYKHITDLTTRTVFSFVDIEMQHKKTTDAPKKTYFTSRC